MENPPKNFSYDAKKINYVILFGVWILLSNFTLTNVTFQVLIEMGWMWVSSSLSLHSYKNKSFNNRLKSQGHKTTINLPQHNPPPPLSSLKKNPGSVYNLR